MIEWLLGGLMAAAAIYQAVALAACLRHLRRSDPDSPERLPGISVLKPVRGADPRLADAFRSHARQRYSEFELILGAASLADPALAVARTVAAEFPSVSLRIIHSASRALNGKVAVLKDLEREAAYPLLVINDSDIEVPPDYLRQVTSPLQDRGVGLVTCLYSATASSFPGRFEALGIATDFAPSILVAPLVGVNEFGLGSTLALRRETLAEIGGFDAIAPYLADDYQFGRHISHAGYRVHLSRTVVRTHLGAQSFRDVWRHQVRWARTVRVSRGAGYAGSILTNASLWATLGILAGLWQPAMLLLAFRCAVGAFAGIAVLDCTVTRTYWWLIPARDLFGAAVWAAGLAGSRVRWRDRLITIDAAGRIVDESTL